MILRQDHLSEIKKRLRSYPVVAILGPRQCGKTTLAKEFKSRNFFDLEDPRDAAQLEEPLSSLESLRGLVVIDEVQRRPGLFPILRVLADQKVSRHFLLLGSASPELVKQSSETLAGRISYWELSGFIPQETGVENLKKLWLRGGMPRSYLASSEHVSFLWRRDYIKDFLERDIPQLGIGIPSATLRRFWTMLAHYHGQVVQYAEIARSFGISDMTVRRYIEILEGTFMVRNVQPWHANLGKRQVKHPKLYFSDSGLLHALLDIRNEKDLKSHPKLGASWEGFVFQILWQKLHSQGIQPYFWATHAGAELDFFWQKGGKNYGLEIKYTDAPRLTPSMKTAFIDLKLSKLIVVYPGEKIYGLGKGIEVVPLGQFSLPKESSPRPNKSSR